MSKLVIPYTGIKSTCGTYLTCWLCRSILIHLPRVSSDVLIFPASFKRSPTFWVLAHRSEPARSHKDSLQNEHIIITVSVSANASTPQGICIHLQTVRSPWHLLTDCFDSRKPNILNPHDPDGKDAMAEQRLTIFLQTTTNIQDPQLSKAILQLVCHNQIQSVWAALKSSITV